MAQPEHTKQRLAILGSTGSIGVQTLDVVRQWKDLFEVNLLVAANNWEALAEQAEEFEPDAVIIANEAHYEALSARLADLPVKVYTGESAAAMSVTSGEVDTVVSAMVGFAGLEPTLAAIRAGKKIALANKEVLVVAGELVMEEAKRYKAPIFPVDSEHSAVFQCLVGEVSPARKVILTASGGAVRDWDAERLADVTVEDAMKHPNWEMGPKITVDSATMMNKGFEVIEAKWLFDLRPEQIEVAIHPQSVVHSLVEFEDGAIKAQLGEPDMRVPIQYALTFPYRLPLDGQPAKAKRWSGIGLDFREVDEGKYPCLGLAYDVLKGKYGKGGACVMNAANEVAVQGFLDRKVKFTDIHRLVEETMRQVEGGEPKTLEDYTRLDRTAREEAEKIMNQKN